MTKYDFDRPYIEQAQMKEFSAIDPREARKFGRIVRATELSNVEYKARYSRLAKANNMREPPGTGRIFMGFLVIRRLGTPEQYETWMPTEVFDEMYVEA